MNHRIDKLAERLRNEAQSLTDYRTIEQRSAQLGFPTSVRTLRFYVSEGILPPPRKRGKVPVFPRDWILSVLLSIHLMKTRFSRSLTEIRWILQGLAESPEVLAEKLTDLYETVNSNPLRLTALQERRLVDRFFAVLSGRSPAGAEPTQPPLQPSQIVLAELLEEQPLPVAHRDGGTRERSRDPRRDRARHLENVFMRAFESAARSLQSVFHPGIGRLLTVREKDLSTVIGDEYDKVARILIERRLFDRDLFDAMPLNKSTRFELCPSRGHRAAGVAFVGVSWSPLPELVDSLLPLRRLGPGDLEAIIRKHAAGVGGEEFVYLGVHATSGIESEVLRVPPAGRHFATALVVFEEETGWHVRHSFVPEAQVVVSIFDPEPLEEKIGRLRRRLANLGELRVPGGFVDLNDIARQWDLNMEVLEEAVRRLQQADPRLEITTVDQHRILRRARHVT